MKTSSLLGAIVVTVAFAGMAQAASIQWGTTGSGILTDGTNPLAWGADATTGGYIQLVYAGADGYDGFDSGSLDGTQGNDVVVATAYVGQGQFHLPPAIDGSGKFTGTPYDGTLGTDFSTGDTFAVVFYSDITPGAGASPTTGFYGVETFTVAITADTQTDVMNIAAPSAATTPVPEPGTVMLALAGIGALISRRRRNRK